jgi:mono/diheme cytochrome c family protein
VLSGIRPTAGERSPIMPGFADTMSDEQITTLLDHLRSRFSSQPPWTNTADIVRDARRTQTVFLQTPPAPSDATKRDKP